jgi:ribonuclease-3
MSDALQSLQDRIGYRFRRRELLVEAVTHPSYLQEHPEIPMSNQRLEFLGDAVLMLLLTEELYTLYPDDREGQLSRRRAALSKGQFLSILARELGLDGCLLLSSSEESTGGRTRAAALEDAFESLVGALYLDSDLPTTRRVVLALYGPLAHRLVAVEDIENPKGRLQELVQPKHGNSALRYEVTATAGEAHQREYQVTVFLLDRPLGTGTGTAKKIAEEAAARAALDALKSTGV